MLLNILRQKKGQALVQIAVMLAVLIGLTALVVDVGGMYLTKTQLQRMADAGALAGASRLEYGKDSANTMAGIYVGKNKLPSYSSDPDSYTYIPDPDPSVLKIKVTVTRPAFFNFAQVLGITPPTITATATASRLGGLSGLKPWALTGNEDFHYKLGEPFRLKEGGGGGTRGWFNAIHFKSSDSNGANIYKNYIINGCDVTMSIGDLVYATPGNMATGDKAIETATGLSAGQDYSLSDYTNVSLTSPNVVFVPEVDSNMKIIGFAAVYITAFGKSSTGGNGSIDVVFLNDTFWTGTNTNVTSEFKTKLEYQ